MNPLPIVKYGDPRLKITCKDITQDFDSSPKLQETAKQMLLTMYDEPGVGLAATQVGLDYRIAVIDDGEGPRILINPYIIELSEETESEEEGCLSVPDIRGKVERSLKIKYRADQVIFNGETIGNKEQIFHQPSRPHLKTERIGNREKKQIQYVCIKYCRKIKF